MDERVEGDHFMGKWAEGNSMDKRGDRGLFPGNTEMVISGGGVRKNSYVEEIDILASYFDGEMYEGVETIQK